MSVAAASSTTVRVYELCGSGGIAPTHGAGLTRIPAVSLPVGRCPPGMLDRLVEDAVALQIVEGLLVRDVHVGGAIACELLGPSDVVGAMRERGATATGGSWMAAAPTVIAVIDLRVTALLTELPDLAAGLLTNAVAQTDRVTRQRVIAQLPRVEDRVLGLFLLLAERWGRVTPAGTTIPIALTHETVGRLIGARRPTVSLALKRLAADGALARRDDGSWLLGAVSSTQLGARRVHGPSEVALLTGARFVNTPLSVRGRMTRADMQHTRDRVARLAIEFDERRRVCSATLARCAATRQQISAGRRPRGRPAPAP